MFAKRLKALRKEKGKTQQDMSDYLGITRPAYTAYEIGNRQPDYDLLKKIADYFEVTTDYLLGRSDKPHLTEEEEFQAFINDPELERWYRELPKSKEEDLRRLRRIWEVIKEKE